jgi:arginine/lysine/histidine/glutamine transport system substrate-binding and permease protein
MAKFGFERWLRWYVIVGFSCLLLAGCAVNSGAKKTLQVATEPTFPPFEFQKQGGKLQGFAIDLMNANASSTPGAIAVAANFKVDFQSLPFDGTISALTAKTVDAVINDAPVTLYAIDTDNIERIKIIQQLLTEEFYGIATAKNSPNLALINNGLDRVLKNGTYSQIYQKWFKVKPPLLPVKLPFEKETNTGVPKKITSIGLILQALPTLLQGALVTLQLTVLSVVFGLIGGSLIGIVRLSRIAPVRWIARAYVDFFRGTPLLVQIFMIYFGLPAILQELGLTFTFDRLVAGVIALSLNSAAYIAEVVRAGIQSIETGQSEAALSLGLSSVQTMTYVIFPQAFRRMIPPLGNEFISLLKDTSLVAVIGFEELFRKGQLIVADNYRAFEIYAAVAVVYLCLTLLSSQAFSRLEVWMNPVQRHKKYDT